MSDLGPLRPSCLFFSIFCVWVRFRNTQILSVILNILYFRRVQFSMGPQEDYIETVFTCEGDFDDPHLQDRLDDFQSSLKDLLLTGMNNKNSKT